MKTYGVIMAGGGGTRFWPLSRKAKPKQFLNLSGKDTMVMDTANRLASFMSPEDIFIVTGKDFVDSTAEGTGTLLRADHILGEPAARNTAACIGYAAMEIVKKYEDGVMCIVPSDHFIKDEAEYKKVMEYAISIAEQRDALVTIGIKPTFPSTGYGYIRYEKSTEADAEYLKDTRVSYDVLEFVEKPDLDRAKEYVDSGQFAWNSGMFVWKASLILQYFEKLLPDIYECLTTIGEAMGTEREAEVIEEIYPVIPKISIDYGIMERAKGVLMVEGDFGWNDVGSFDALQEIYQSDENGNVCIGNTCALETKGCILYNDGKKLIATLGVENVIVAQTEDIVLICDKTRAQEVKKFPEIYAQKDDSFC